MALTEDDKRDIANFKFGIYEHYKGGRYTAFMILQHHDTRKPMVAYVSHEKGSANCRPLRGWYQEDGGTCVDTDGWLDEVPYTAPGVGMTGERVPRFRYVGPAQS